ncbi:hypothetical protein [Microbacterium sp. NPDC096154]|uniref:hypothetical protein n=1 Tax=Microbacterium sp. NPDC096154 TaxID=3155549 RepID=UPI00332A69F8
MLRRLGGGRLVAVDERDDVVHGRGGLGRRCRRLRLRGRAGGARLARRALLASRGQPGRRIVHHVAVVVVIVVRDVGDRQARRREGRRAQLLGGAGRCRERRCRRRVLGLRVLGLRVLGLRSLGPAGAVGALLAHAAGGSGLGRRRRIRRRRILLVVGRVLFVGGLVGLDGAVRMHDQGPDAFGLGDVQVHGAVPLLRRRDGVHHDRVATVLDGLRVELGQHVA